VCSFSVYVKNNVVVSFLAHFFPLLVDRIIFMVVEATQPVSHRKTEKIDLTDTAGLTEIFYHLTPTLSTKKETFGQAESSTM
jgi:hypothetical protein